MPDKAFTWKGKAFKSFSDFIAEFSELWEQQKLKGLYNNHPTSDPYCSLLLNTYYVSAYCAGSFTSMASLNSYSDPTRYSHFTDEENEHQKS